MTLAKHQSNNYRSTLCRSETTIKVNYPHTPYLSKKRPPHMSYPLPVKASPEALQLPMHHNEEDMLDAFHMLTIDFASDGQNESATCASPKWKVLFIASPHLSGLKITTNNAMDMVMYDWYILGVPESMNPTYVLLVTVMCCPMVPSVMSGEGTHGLSRWNWSYQMALWWLWKVATSPSQEPSSSPWSQTHKAHQLWLELGWSIFLHRSGQCNWVHDAEHIRNGRVGGP